MQRAILYAIPMAFMWTAIIGQEFIASFILGYILSVIILWGLFWKNSADIRLFRSLRALVQYIFRVLWDLVVADLTGRNPNVFYELALRHTIKKPFVQIMQEGERIPFDVAVMRTIFVDHTDLDSVARCIDEMKRQIRAFEDKPDKIESPVSRTVELRAMRQSDVPIEQQYAEIMSVLQDIQSGIKDRSKIDKYFDTERRSNWRISMLYNDILSYITAVAYATIPSDYLIDSFRLLDHMEDFAEAFNIPEDTLKKIREYKGDLQTVLKEKTEGEDDAD